MKINIPFLPLPLNEMIRISKKLVGIGDQVSKLFPFLKNDLKIAGINITPEIYGAIIAIVFFIYAILGSIIGYVFASRFVPQLTIQAFVVSGLLAGLLTSIQVAVYPKILIKKKVRDIERNLIFGLRTILVEIKAGVTLFDAIGIVAKEQNGELSNEFEKTVTKIQTGTYQNTALEELAENTPSIYFKRSIWQLVNGLKSGGDVGTVMQSLVELLTKEKSNQVKKYGNTLKMLSVVYMMLGVIVPALGLTFLIILSILPNSLVNEQVFYVMLAMLGLGQFMFIGVIKSARPALLGD
ncbi:MAG: type II secretion system F family protein [Candidatus Diapherotrites archaeon]